MHSISTIFRTALSATLAMFLLTGSAHAAVKSWKISESSGEVTLETDSGNLVATRGMALNAGDAVHTGASGRAVIVRGGEYVIVSPKSRVRITKSEKAGGFTQIFQSIGSVMFKIKKKETPHFRVKTPYLAAVVKGTTFNVTVTQNGATVQVTEGRVEVSTLDGGASDMIIPGRIGRIDANDKQLLKILGADGKSIRSPLPAVEGDTVLSDDGEDAQSSEDKEGDDQAVTIGSDEKTNVPNNADAGFSGRIGSPLSSEPVSLAVITGGLVSNSRAAEAASDRVRNDINTAPNGNPSAPVGGGSNTVSNGNDATGSIGSSESGGNSNNSSDNDESQDDDGRSGGSSNTDQSDDDNSDDNVGSSNGTGNSDRDDEDGDDGGRSNGSGSTGRDDENEDEGDRDNSGSNENSDREDDDDDSRDNGNSNSGGNGNSNSGGNAVGNGNSSSNSNGTSNSGGANGSGNSGNNGGGNGNGNSGSSGSSGGNSAGNGNSGSNGSGSGNSGGSAGNSGNGNSGGNGGRPLR